MDTNPKTTAPLRRINYLPKFPRTDLLFNAPLQIQELKRFRPAVLCGDSSCTEDFPNAPKIWLCREDMNSPLSFGGNKIRKLECVFFFSYSRASLALVRY
jgi:1-aminocyclopropane-1-carboxylate deaminase/D-cysteine desulfhydrase-like pyridoxal-dependent ACC family enzyme